MRSSVFMLALLILGIPALYFSHRLFRSMDSAGQPAFATTDLQQYPQVLSDWSNTHLTSHFPPALPDSSQLPCLSASKKFMQGGAYIRLQLTLPADEIGRWDEHWRSKAIEPNEQIGQPPMQNVSNRFRVYLLKAQPQGDENHRWNHGDLAYVGIDPSANQILYGAESW